MAFCSFAKDLIKTSFTSVENTFINKFLSLADGNAVKVYLYSLYLCQNSDRDCTIENMSRALNMSVDEVVSAFELWEELDIVTILSRSPFTVRVLPADSVATKAKSIRPEKYGDFAKSLQAMNPDKMISPTEFSAYFSIMEEYPIKPEAMLMIIKYCADKGDKVYSYKYNLKVIRSFIDEGCTTVEKIEKKLNNYLSRSADIQEVLNALSIRRNPTIDDYNLYRKWTSEFSFEKENIIFAATTAKLKKVEKLDALLVQLQNANKYSKEEIEEYLSNQSKMKSLTIDIARRLGVYVEVIETYTNEYVYSWKNFGYSDTSLLTLATYCFKRNNKSFEAMNELIGKLFALGVVSDESLAEYIAETAQEEEFILALLKRAGLSRRPTSWDKENLKTWRSWNFSDEMLLKAAEISHGKTSPIPYMNAMLSGWKTQGIFNVESIIRPSSTNQNKNNENKVLVTKEDIERHYAQIRDSRQAIADKNVRIANSYPEFREIAAKINETEIDLAKSEFLEPQKTKEYDEALKALYKERAAFLKSISLTLADLKPSYACKQCKDTGYLPDGEQCSCLKEFITQKTLGTLVQDVTKFNL